MWVVCQHSQSSLNGMLPRIRFFILALSSCITISLCGNVTLGGNCSLTNNRVDAASHVFETDCDTQTFCSLINPSITTSSAGTCQAKRCRRDEWPFGYAPGAISPPLCEDGYYCPDEEDGCKGLIEFGGKCQLGRDGEILFTVCFVGSRIAIDECALSPPPNRAESHNTSTTTGMSVCLQSTCL